MVSISHLLLVLFFLTRSQPWIPLLERRRCRRIRRRDRGSKGDHDGAADVDDGVAPVVGRLAPVEREGRKRKRRWRCEGEVGVEEDIGEFADDDEGEGEGIVRDIIEVSGSYSLQE